MQEGGRGRRESCGSLNFRRFSASHNHGVQEERCRSAGLTNVSGDGWKPFSRTNHLLMEILGGKVGKHFVLGVCTLANMPEGKLSSKPVALLVGHAHSHMGTQLCPPAGWQQPQATLGHAANCTGNLFCPPAGPRPLQKVWPHS